MQFVVWYLLISLIGLAVFPITRRLFSKGVAQGYLFSRVVALFLWGLFYWLFGSLRIIRVDLSGTLFVLLGICVVSFLISKKNFKEEITAPLREHKSAIITGEVLFIMAFLFMVLLKSMYPNLDHTEKPMDMAFINGILRSESFPPRDPWLAGYGISYYYFGYVIVSLMIRVTGVAPAVGYNLALSLWYALSALAIYGVVYQFLYDWRKRRTDETKAKSWCDRKGAIYALLAPVFALFSGNFEGLFEILYARGFFWTTLADGTKTSAFWTWLDLSDLKNPPFSTQSFIPSRSNWWWWQGSRVLQDYDIVGNAKEIIDEFPFFSYFLGDFHPHMLGMPFVITAVAIAYQFFLRLKDVKATENIFQDGKQYLADAENLWTLVFSLIFIGGISFLNTWDFPVYFGLFLLVLIFWRIHHLGWSSQRIFEFITSGILFGFVSLVLYIPFFTSFASQAGGLLPSLVYFTTGKHMWIFFGGLFIPILIWLIFLYKEHSQLGNFVNGLVSAAGIYLLLLVISILFSILAFSVANTQLTDNPIFNLGNQIIASQGYGGTRETIVETILRRFSAPGGWITLVTLFGLILSLLGRRNHGDEKTLFRFTTESSFMVLLTSIGLFLIAFPEFFYLQDGFGWRMNTIFKFYYQAWLLLSVAAAYGSIVILTESKGLTKTLLKIGMLLVLVIILIYPGMASFYRFTIDHNPVQSLDGMFHLRYYNPDEADAIDWLRGAEDGVVVEAVGGSYRADYGKVSSLSGLPTILGWPGHEGQWRGGYEEIGNREEEVREIYQLRDWEDTMVLLDQYHVRYIYIGSVEQSTYRIEFDKFYNHLGIAYQNDSVVIFEYLPEYDLVN
jgi:YYY domain-containing protein